MPHVRIGAAAYQFVIFLEHNSIAPITPQVDSRPDCHCQAQDRDQKPSNSDCLPIREESETQKSDRSLSPEEEAKSKRENDESQGTVKPKLSGLRSIFRCSPIKRNGSPCQSQSPEDQRRNFVSPGKQQRQREHQKSNAQWCARAASGCR